MIEEQQKIGLTFDTNQRYACTDCKAKCCRNPWKYPVSTKEATNLRAIPWVAERLKAAGVDFVGDDQTGYNLPRVSWPEGGQACAFLDADNLCAIQKQEGHAAIPKTCQDYPFSFVADGDRTIYSVTSYFCPSIRHNYGTPLNETIEARFRQWQEGRTMPSLPDSIPMGGFVLQKDAYLALADALEALFARPDLSVAQALLAGRQLLWEMIAANLGQASVSRESIEATTAAFSRQLPEQALPEVPERPLIGRVILSMELMALASEPLHLAHQAAGKPENNFRFVYIGQLLRMIQDQGTLMLWDFPKAVDLAQARVVRINEHNPELQAALKRYYLHLLKNRHLFCQGEDFIKTYFRLGGSYPMILKLARFLANAQDRREAAMEDYLDAIGYTDILVTSRSRTVQDWLSKVRESITGLLATRQDSFERLVLSESFNG
jgi:lysine-N-methylase